VSTEPVFGGAADDGSGPKLALAVDAADSAGPAIDATRLRVALARLSRRLRRHELAGLTPTQLAALATVGRSGPMRLGDLAAAEGIAPSTLTRLVTALEDSGYVGRHADPSDARASTLAITPHGQEALERIRTESTLALAASMQVLTPAQRAALADALPVLEQLAEVQGPGVPGSGPAGTRDGLRTVLPVPVRHKRILRSVGQAAGQLVTLPGDLRQLVLEFDDAADRLQRDAFVGHRDDLLDDADLEAGVAALAAG
jgi:DNA-binding MarR family transcriptional regulator